MKKIRAYIANLNEKTRHMDKEKRNLWVIAAGYLVFLMLFLSHFGFNPSATINFSGAHMAQYKGEIPSGIVVHHNDGFDGQYYYFIALNPSFTNIQGVGWNFLQRIVYPTLARTLALSLPPFSIHFLPLALLLVNLCAALISSMLLMKLLSRYGSSPNWAFVWAFSTGILISLSCNTTELLMITLVIAAMFFLEKEKHWLAVASLALAMMTRESSITLITAFVVYFLVRFKFGRALQYALSIVPFVIWQAVFYYRFHIIPFRQTPQALSIPAFITNQPAADHSFVTTAITKVEHLQQIQSNVQTAVAHPSLFETLSSIYQTISPWPIVIFVAIITCMAVWNFLKERKITLYVVLLFSQISFMFLITPKILLTEGVEATGRYVIGLVTVSILYFASRGKKYSKVLAFLLIGSAAAYVFQRAIVPKGPYHITNKTPVHRSVPEDPARTTLRTTDAQ